MKILIDMNLSPAWVPVLRQAGHDPVHWSEKGDPRAPDHEIMEWAKTNRHVVFTHDLDFGAILAASQADCPSVIQFRVQDTHPASLGPLVVRTLKKFKDHLEKGALITLDESKARIRLLPMQCIE